MYFFNYHQYHQLHYLDLKITINKNYDHFETPKITKTQFFNKIFLDTSKITRYTNQK